MKTPTQIKPVVTAYYEAFTKHSITEQLRKKLYKEADKIVDDIMRKYELHQIMQVVADENNLSNEKLVIAIELVRKS